MIDARSGCSHELAHAHQKAAGLVSLVVARGGRTMYAGRRGAGAVARPRPVAPPRDRDRERSAYAPGGGGPDGICGGADARRVSDIHAGRLSTPRRRRRRRRRRSARCRRGRRSKRIDEPMCPPLRTMARNSSGTC